MSRQKVFVYGTLRKGYGNHNACLAGAPNLKFMGKGKTVGTFNMRSGGFPFVSQELNDGNDSTIVGELYEVEESTLLGPLDGLEGHPDFYTRKMTQIVLDDSEHGDVEEAWMYFLNHNGIQGDAVPTGDFSDYKNKYY